MGRRLLWVRQAMGLNQTEAARIVGLTQTAWSSYELGKRCPDQFELPRLIAKLKITREYLMEGDLSGIDRGLAAKIADTTPEATEDMKVNAARKEGFNEGIEAAAAFMSARAERIRSEGAGNISLMMAKIYKDEAAGIAALKR
jgi:transcriptional regulator with XRE-family HTH domain